MTLISPLPRNPDPFGNIPDPSAEFAGTVLETSAEREQRAGAELTVTAGKAE